jgi:hypothetical protein
MVVVVVVVVVGGGVVVGVNNSIMAPSKLTS